MSGIQIRSDFWADDKAAFHSIELITINADPIRLYSTFVKCAYNIYCRTYSYRGERVIFRAWRSSRQRARSA